jgi:hypothetical protein
MAITLTGSVPSAASFTAAYKAASQSISGGGSTPLKAPSGTTVKNASGQLINDAGDVVGGAVTSSGQLSYDGKTAIPGSSTYRDTGITTIKPSDLASVPAVQIPAAPTPAPAYNYMNLITGGNAMLGNYDTKTNQFIPQATPTSDATTDLFKEYLGGMEKPPSVADEYDKARKETGLVEKQNLVNTLTGQLNSIVANAQAAQLAEVGQGRGIPEAIIGGRQAQIAKEAAIAALPIQAQLAAAQGAVAIAEQQLDTLFKLRSQDALTQYQYRKDVRDKVYDFASKQEQRRLDKIDKAEERVYDIIKTNLASMDSWAKEAVKTGQASLITKFASLDPASPTFRQDMGKLQSELRSVDYTFKTLADGRDVMIDKMGNIVKVVSEAPMTKEQKEALVSQAEAQKAIPDLEDRVAQINSLINDKGYKKVVGTTGFGRTPLLSSLTGEAQNAAANIKQLTSQETLQTLINLKAKGGTLGALNEGERITLESAATKIGAWEIKEDGVGTGRYNANENDFKKELEKIRTLTQRAIDNARGVTDENPLGLDLPLGLEAGVLDPLGVGI